MLKYPHQRSASSSSCTGSGVVRHLAQSPAGSLVEEQAQRNHVPSTIVGLSLRTGSQAKTVLPFFPRSHKLCLAFLIRSWRW